MLKSNGNARQLCQGDVMRLYGDTEWADNQFVTASGINHSRVGVL